MIRQCTQILLSFTTHQVRAGYHPQATGEKTRFRQCKDMALGPGGTIMALGLVVRPSLTLKIEVVKITFKGPILSPENKHSHKGPREWQCFCVQAEGLD